MSSNSNTLHEKCQDLGLNQHNTTSGWKKVVCPLVSSPVISSPLLSIHKMYIFLTLYKTITIHSHIAYMTLMLHS